MTSVFKSKVFARFARKTRISDADLGGGVIKQRIARAGQGKSGGSRSIILYRNGDRAVFVYGFEKKDRSNIDTDELKELRELAKVVLGYSPTMMQRMVAIGEFVVVETPKGESDGG